MKSFSDRPIFYNLTSKTGRLRKGQSTKRPLLRNFVLVFVTVGRAARFFVLLLSLYLGVTGLPFNHYANVIKAATPICTNTVSGGVYWDANGDGARESNEIFLAGTIQVINPTNLTINTFQSPDGFFTLNDIACDTYTVYHNGDDVGSLVVDEVMGQTFIELPKTHLTGRLFLPLVTRT